MTAVAEKNRVEYCEDCSRIVGVGCACGLTFAEKMKSTATILPASFRAV